MTIRQQLIAWIILTVLFVLAVFATRDILLPFVAGLAVAYFLDPMVDRLEERGLSRTFSTTIVLTVFFIVVIAATLMFLPVLYSQILGFSERVPGYIVKLREAILPFLDQLGMVLGVDVNEKVKSALPNAGNDLFRFGTQILKELWSSSLAFFNLASLLVITPIVAFYLVRDWDLIVARVNEWIPRQHAGELRQLFRDFDTVMAGFVRGQGSVCIVMAVYYGSALSLTGLEFGLVIGIFSGLISFVPFVGATLGLFLAAVTAITQFWPDYIQIGLIAGIFIFGQFLEGNFLTPRLLGGRIGLHPVWVIFALMAGGALFGFVGVLLAVPMAAIIGVLVRYLLKQYLSSRLFLGHRAESEVDEIAPRLED